MNTVLLRYRKKYFCFFASQVQHLLVSEEYLTQ